MPDIRRWIAEEFTEDAEENISNQQEELKDKEEQHHQEEYKIGVIGIGRQLEE